jgi:UDP-GlcNAc:undecaprenyl-phosphate GlcNAc-1-phosphate transferase
MLDILWFVLPGVAAGAVAAALTPLVGRIALVVGAVDMPGERKVHTAPVPRLGGLAVVTAIAMAFAGAPWLSAGRWHLPAHLAAGIGFGVLPILFVSILDDIKSVGASTKMLAHLLGAGIAVSLGISLAPVVHLFGTPIHVGWLAWPISVAWIVGVTNAFNIIDGLDGLSSGLALISALCMTAVFALVGQPEMAGVTLVLAGALAGFLPYNIHPARLFLGDTGATAIGFCLATFALRGGSTLSSGFAALLPVFILGLPIADTVIAMLRRTMRRMEDRRAGVFQADRDHIHHRLLALGIDHARAVLLLYAAGLVLAGAALISIFVTAREAAFMVTALLLAGVVGIQRLDYDEFAFIRRGTVLRVYEIPAVKRGFFIVLVDIALSFVSAYLTVGLKTDVWSLSLSGGSVLEIATTMAPVTVIVFVWRRMYKGSWRVAGIHDLTKAAAAVFIATPIGALVLRTFAKAPYPLSLFALYGLLTLLLTVSIRASYVILRNSKLRSSHAGMPILIYGAGRRGASAVHELFQNESAGLRPIGFIDDDPDKRGRTVNGIPVLGSSRELRALLQRAGAKGVLISTPLISTYRVERCTAICEAISIGVFRLDLSVRQMAGSHVVPTPPAPQPVTVEEPEFDARLGSQLCPSCGKSAAFRSKARNSFERFRKVRTQKRLYRCEECGWRGWLLPLEFAVEAAVGKDDVLNFGDLDGAVRKEPRPTASVEALDFK